MAGNKKRLVFLSYAVNGAGVGHVVRQIAIQQWLRRLCAFAGVHSEHWFLTTSEADSLVFQAGFAAFKLPSKSIVEPAGIDKLSYIAMAKVWVNNSIALLRPDVLLVDTFAQGSFNELPAVLDLVPTKVLVQRPLKDGYANRPAYQQLVGAYDVVVVPEHEDDVPEMRELLAVPSSRLRFVGPIVRIDPAAVFSREDARAKLGVPANARCVLVTGGGGGDVGNDALFDTVATALHSSDDVHVVYAVGPLFRGRSRHGPRATQFSGADLAEHAAAFDVAVSAAGFNTIHELLVGGVPTIVVPQDKIADDQRQRAERYAERGAVVVVDGLGQVGSTLRSLLADDAKLAALSTAAKAVLPRGHAKEAAAAALSMSMAPSVLRAAVDVVDDALLTQLGSIGLDEIVT
ncbi:MAG TPA: glycosyltransferase, partial [Myxococcota bacterium]